MDPMVSFDGIRAGVLADRSQFFKDLAVPFYVAHRPERRELARLVRRVHRRRAVGSEATLVKGVL